MINPSSIKITIPYDAIYLEKHFYKFKDTYFTVEKKIAGKILISVFKDSAGVVTLKGARLLQTKGDDKTIQANSHRFVLRCIHIDVLPFDFNEDWVPEVPKGNIHLVTQLERTLMNDYVELSSWRESRLSKKPNK